MLGDPTEEGLEHHRAAMERGAKCLQCPLYNCGEGPVMGRIVPNAALAVVGEAPSSTDVEEGRIFAGGVGEVIYEALFAGGIQREQLTMTNAILCRPPGGHMLDYAAALKVKHRAVVAKCKAEGEEPPPLITPQDCCAVRLATDLTESNSRTLLGLGTEGLKALAHACKLPFANAKVAPGTPRVATLKKQHGSPVLVGDGRVLTSAMHPAFALFSNSTYMPIIRADIIRAATIALRGGVIDWQEPEFILRPSLDVCINVINHMRTSLQMVTVDIETDGIDVQTVNIRCIGLGTVIDGREVIIVVPLRHMNGRSWWMPGDESRLITSLTNLLEENPLSGHNLSFDTAVLLKQRILFNRGKRWFDTMVAHHDTNQSELPHDLGFVAGRAFEAPRWKDDADHKNVEGVDDITLHRYCAKDVLGEMRLVVPLATQIKEQGTIEAFKTDTMLMPVARDMGDLGLNIHEQRRRIFFDILNKATVSRTADLRRITGLADFNPNAFKQVSRFLYITKGLSPPYATDGREWAELSAEDEELPLDTDDEDVILAKAATNELSLLRLLELGVDAHTREFIEAQLQYRGLQKCKATYMGMKYDDDGQLIDTHRKRGFMHTESHGPGLDQLSILHTNWKLHIVPTGRWSTQPAVQNWPERVVWDTNLYKASIAAGWGEKGKPFDQNGGHGIINTRAIVVAPPGYTLVGADYAAVELRIYAIQSGDALLLDAIYTGKDPHALNYATMMARNPSEVMTWYERVKNAKPVVKKYLRNVAKRFGFLEIYGGQKDTLFKTMSSDRNPDGTLSFPDLKPGDVAMWHDNFHRAHPELKRWHEAVVRAWTTHGFVATLIDGRRRFFIGGLDPTAMPNHTVQGTAAAVTNRAMIAIAAQCPHRGWGPLAGPMLQVHDFIGLQVPDARVKEAEELLCREMPYAHLGMKFEVEQKSGPSWDVI